MGFENEEPEKVKLTLNEEGAIDAYKDQWLSSFASPIGHGLYEAHRRACAARSLFTLLRRDMEHAEDARLHRGVTYTPLNGYLKSGVVIAIDVLLAEAIGDFETVLESAERKTQ